MSVVKSGANAGDSAMSDKMTVAGVDDNMNGGIGKIGKLLIECNCAKAKTAGTPDLGDLDNSVTHTLLTVV